MSEMYFPGGTVVKKKKKILLPMQETQEMQVQSLGWEDPLEQEMATYSHILAWKIPQTEELGRLQSMGSQRVRQLSTHTTQPSYNIATLQTLWILFLFSSSFQLIFFLPVSPSFSKVKVLVTHQCLILCDPIDYIAHQTPLSMEFSSQEYCSGQPFPFPGNRLDPGIKPGSPAFQADSLPTELQGKPDWSRYR